MRTKLLNAAHHAPIKIKDALMAEVAIEVKECKAIAPVYTGPRVPSAPVPNALKDSIHAEGPFYEGLKIYAKIVAGGKAVAYALRQHEETTWFHKIGQAKYIEGPLFASQPFMASRVGARLKMKDLVG